jgi:hypothetical protein
MKFLNSCPKKIHQKIYELMRIIGIFASVIIMHGCESTGISKDQARIEKARKDVAQGHLTGTCQVLEELSLKYRLSQADGALKKQACAAEYIKKFKPKISNLIDRISYEEKRGNHNAACSLFSEAYTNSDEWDVFLHLKKDGASWRESICEKVKERERLALIEPYIRDAEAALARGCHRSACENYVRARELYFPPSAYSHKHRGNFFSDQSIHTKNMNDSCKVSRNRWTAFLNDPEATNALNIKLMQTCQVFGKVRGECQQSAGTPKQFPACVRMKLGAAYDSIADQECIKAEKLYKSKIDIAWGC